MKIFQKNSRIFLCTFILLCSITSLQAQVSPVKPSQWVAVESYDNFRDGIYSPLFGANLQLISLYRGLAPYEFGHQQMAKVIFTSPKAGENYFFAAQEKIVSHYYRMQSEAGTKTESGTNHIKGWPIDGMLKQYGIQAENLALLAQYGEADAMKFLPVNMVIEGSDKPVEDSYIACYRVNASISKGFYNLYLGEYRGLLPDKPALPPKRIGAHLEGSPIELWIDLGDKKDYQGWITVDITLSVSNSDEQLHSRFFFYHHLDPE